MSQLLRFCFVSGMRRQTLLLLIRRDTTASNIIIYKFVTFVLSVPKHKQNALKSPETPTLENLTNDWQQNIDILVNCGTFKREFAIRWYKTYYKPIFANV